MLDSLFMGNKDGGITTSIIQAQQSGDPMVIIGLGGTGVDAISSLKRKLYKQIAPDNVEGVNSGEEPQYHRIKFLGIDADGGKLEQSELTFEEKLNIQKLDYQMSFSQDRLESLKRQKNMQWMSVDYIANHLPVTPNGAGACRQFGRWLTITSADVIKWKLTQLITQAIEGINPGHLTVHIISSVSGGMGSGSFVDVSYIIRDILNGLGLYSSVFGYFVLPDAIISKLGIVKNEIKKQVQQSNGIASLLEIEHLMNLKDSHEWFEQDYGAFQIKTQHNLVDMCNFISATNINGKPMPNGYEYALNVIGDYILGFISKEQKATPTSTPITMTGNLSNIEADLLGIVPEHGRGYSQNYHIIGSANAEIPITQMATYLASKLFENFTISENMPNETQIKQEFADYLHLSDSSFEKLEQQFSVGAEWKSLTEQVVSEHYTQIKAHMNDDILPAKMISPIETSLRMRKSILVQKREQMEEGVDNYVYQPDNRSIPGLAISRLIEISENLKEGPAYAYGMMNQAGMDIFHHLEARIRYYESQEQNARNQEVASRNKESEAKKKLGNANVINKNSSIKEYTAALNQVYYWQSQADLFEEMKKLMINLTSAFRAINDKYLRPFYQFTKELMETFEANRQFFENGKGDESQDGYTIQLVKFSNIQPILDDALGRLDCTQTTAEILKMLMDCPDIWMEHKELRVKAKISDYILSKFSSVLSGSLENFLRIGLNMETANDRDFSHAILDKIIQPLMDEATPVFWTYEPLVFDRTKTVHSGTLVVPGVANNICMAADVYTTGNSGMAVRKTLINDRIYVSQTISGIPMHAYEGLTQYLDAYENCHELGLHLYERDVNWREILTFPYPYSQNPKYTKNAEELLKVYDEAETKGIIFYEDGRAYVKQFEEVPSEMLNIEDFDTYGRIDMELAQQRINQLMDILNNPAESVAINSKGNLPETENSLVKDNFLRFYGIQQIVKREMEKYDGITKTIADIKNCLEDNSKNSEHLKSFFTIVLTDLFEDDGFNLYYKYEKLGVEKSVPMCDNSMPYFGLGKYYQAFQTLYNLDFVTQENMIKNATKKFEIMTAKEKMKRVEELLSLYSPQTLVRISQSYEGTIDYKKMDSFYESFISYLDEIRILLMMINTEE